MKVNKKFIKKNKLQLQSQNQIKHEVLYVRTKIHLSERTWKRMVTM